MKQSAQTPYSNRGFDAEILGTLPLNDPLVLDGIIASFDKIRIKYTYKKTSFLNVEEKPGVFARKRCDTIDHLSRILRSPSLWMNGQFEIDPVRESRFKLGNYTHTITYRLPSDDTFSVLIGRYCCDVTAKGVAPEIILELNPNKIPTEIWQQVSTILAAYATKINVQRFDIAMDFPIKRNQLMLMQRPRSKYQKVVSPTGAITEYTGERSDHGATKLYDKAAELGLPDHACTRCELTIEPQKFSGIIKHFPSILTLAPVDLDLDFSSLPYEVKSVILYPELLPVLKQSVSRDTFAKFKKQIHAYGQTYFAPTDDQAAAIDQYIRDSLVKFKSTAFVK